MSGKVVLIVIAIIVLALGVTGAAFATGMDFSDVVALSSGEEELAQINNDYVWFLSCPDGSGVNRVALSFDRHLNAGSTIWVAVDRNARGWKVLGSFLDKDSEVIIHLDRVIGVCYIDRCNNGEVAVAER